MKHYFSLFNYFSFSQGFIFIMLPEWILNYDYITTFKQTQYCKNQTRNIITNKIQKGMEWPKKYVREKKKGNKPREDLDINTEWSNQCT